MATPLKIEREKRGMTGEDIAVAVGVKAPTISRIENGRYRPSPDLANRIAKFLGNAVTRDQLLFPEDYPLPTPKPARRASARALQEAR
jgi:transcriptional regulator with XRE-family HTH domain